ncbi:MAG: PQQ-binding-like beta-propeller repeat protein [Candidatus Bathyarchaeia archaeon]
MNNRKNKAKTILAIFLLLSFAVTLIALPAANAHSPPWTITTHAFLTVNPNPVGVGQRVVIVAWAGLVLPSAAVTNDIRFHDYKVTITRPDGNTETITWDVVWDTTSTAWAEYVPTQVGTYSFVFSYPDQVYTWSGTYQNDIFLGATSKTVYLTVQEEQLPDPITSYPLPTEYWTRPIEGQNTDWYKIASHWLGYTHPSIYRMVQPDGAAPNSAHVMWTKRIDEGGVVGGSNTGVEGNMFYSGSAYNPRFAAPIIMNGLLFYELPLMNAGTGGGWMCVDLRTGKEIWYNDKMGVDSSWPSPSFGYLYACDTENQHGVIPRGILFSSNFGTAYDPWTGQRLFNVTNVPSGTAAVGPKGEILRYQIDLSRGWLAQWNSSRLWTTSGAGWTPDWNVSKGWVNASSASRYDWNVTIPTTIPTSTSPYFAICDDILLGSSSFAGPSGIGTPNPYTLWAISLKPDSRGALLWIKNYSAPPENITRFLQVVDKVNRVTIFLDKETFQFSGYSIDNGEKLWETTPPENMSDFSYFDVTHAAVFTTAAYGRLYHSGWGGVLYCYDTKNGKLLWTYGNGGEGNSTFGGLQTPWGNYPIFIASIADGKVFLFSGEHSPNTPLYKGWKIRAVNATNGEELWTMLGSMGYPPRSYYPVAEGFIVYYNMYDGQLYCIGKGPSATTVSASPKISTHGSKILVEGTVIDISAGTKQDEQAARFPHGVPAVADESMGAWMEYVYMQKPKPTDVKGVEVTVTVLDPNGNCYDVATATTDASGFYSCTFEPPVPGKYTIIATFKGSESYWPSSAETAVFVEEAPAATPEPTPTPASMTETYITGFGIAIIAAIAIVGFLLMRKR